MAQDEIEILREQIRLLWEAVVYLQNRVERLEGIPLSENPTGDLGR